jgi:hypothetical protein
MHQIESIDLSFNRLIIIINKIYIYIYELNLDNNLIRKIDPNLFLILTTLRFIDLDSNILKCDINLLWFKTYLINEQFR